jgi:hypothetical protein
MASVSQRPTPPLRYGLGSSEGLLSLKKATVSTSRYKIGKVYSRASKWFRLPLPNCAASKSLFSEGLKEMASSICRRFKLSEIPTFGGVLRLSQYSPAHSRQSICHGEQRIPIAQERNSA